MTPAVDLLIRLGENVNLVISSPADREEDESK